VTGHELVELLVEALAILLQLLNLLPERFDLDTVLISEPARVLELPLAFNDQ